MNKVVRSGTLFANGGGMCLIGEEGICAWKKGWQEMIFSPTGRETLMNWQSREMDRGFPSICCRKCSPLLFSLGHVSKHTSFRIRRNDKKCVKSTGSQKTKQNITKQSKFWENKKKNRANQKQKREQRRTVQESWETNVLHLEEERENHHTVRILCGSSDDKL